MSSLRLLADVHISPLTVGALKSQGYDIVRITDVQSQIVCRLNKLLLLSL